MVMLPAGLASGGQLFVAFVVVAGLATAAAQAQPNEPAAIAIAALGGQVEPDQIDVQFKRGLAVRVEAGQLVNVEHGVLLAGRGVGALPAGVWSRGMEDTTDAELDRQRAMAEQYWGVPLPDLKLLLRIRLAPGQSLIAAIDSLRQQPGVEFAVPVAKPVPAPLPGNFFANQGYLSASPGGLYSSALWSWPGGTGTEVRVCDIEYSWNYAHQDLPAVTQIGPAGVDPFSDNNHGTAVLGELASLNNGWGTSGGVHGAAIYTRAANTSAGYNLAGAITSAAASMRAGDVILLEQQWFGPNGGTKYVPVEWSITNYNAIRQAVGAGVIVVEAAGNGGENLDAAIFSTGNGGHYPFLAANDSGAIIVGAGAAPANAGGSTTDRSRLSFSCYGSTVDLQGWGERVTTTGYGGLYSAEGVNLYYTSTFNGTSSASPTVTNAAAALSSISKAVSGSVLTPAQVKSLLQSTGSAQQSGANPASQNIGPRPNTRAAVEALFGNNDCNSNSRPDAIDIAMNSSADNNHNGIPDECESCAADFDGDGFLDFTDFDEFVGVFESGNARGDFNGDGFLDFTDFDAFVIAFEAGC